MNEKNKDELTCDSQEPFPIPRFSTIIDNYKETIGDNPDQIMLFVYCSIIVRHAYRDLLMKLHGGEITEASMETMAFSLFLTYICNPSESMTKAYNRFKRSKLGTFMHKSIVDDVGGFFDYSIVMTKINKN